MQVYEVKGKRDSIIKYIKSCSKQKIFLIRGRNEGNYATVYVPNNGHSWQKDVANDFGVSIKEYGEAPEYKIAKCGVYLLPEVEIRHSHACNSCRSLLGLTERATRKDKNIKKSEPEIKTVVSVPNLQDFSINGMLSAMKERQHEILSMYDSYDSAIKAIETQQENEKKFKELSEQMEKDRQALAFFIKES